jgi:hypothetical protein
MSMRDGGGEHQFAARRRIVARRDPLAQPPEAEEAAHTIDEIPEARAWFRHVAESHGTHAAVADERLFSLRRNSTGLHSGTHRQECLTAQESAANDS